MFSPLEGKRSRGGGQLLYRPVGSTAWKLMGDLNSFSVSVNVEKEDIYSNEYPTRTLVETTVTQVSADVSFECRAMTDWVRAASVMGNIQYDTQSSVTAKVFTAAAVEVGDIYEIGYRDATITSVTDTADTTTWSEGTDYKFDAKSGKIQVKALPVGGDGDLKVTFDAPAITEADKRLVTGIAQNTTLKVQLMWVGHNAVGVREEVELHNVEVTPTGDRNFLSAEQDMTVQISGKATPDETQPDGYKIGRVRTLA